MKRKSRKYRRNYKFESGTWLSRLLLWLILWIDTGVELPDFMIDKEIINEKQVRMEGLVDWRVQEGTVYSGTSWSKDGCFTVEEKWICVRKVSSLISNKLRNVRKKMENGNGTLRQHINAIHWNMGAKQWQRKVEEIEAVVLQFTPDVFIVTEANMKMDLLEQEREIKGYTMLLPLSADEHGLARLVMLIREGIEVKIQRQFMDNIVAAVWIKIGAPGRKPMILGGMYREHKFIYDNAPADSGTDYHQNQRWFKFIENWKKAAAQGDTIVFGDMNLDYSRWSLPELSHVRMVDKTKDEIETLGFFQVIQGMTRSWSGQLDSQIDHCWTNAPQRLIFQKNLVRSFSDHNLLIISFRTKNKLENKHKILKRERRNFDLIRYRQDIADIDWSEFYKSESLDYLNDFFVTKILESLDRLAPLKSFQRRKSHRNWISDDLKSDMKRRDTLRETARVSGSQQYWAHYRTERNQCVKKLKVCKKNYFKGLFQKVDAEKTTKNLFRLAGELMGRKDYSSPQQYLERGRLVRKPREMANCQLNFYVEKLNILMRKIKTSNRNPLRYLDAAFMKWEDKNEVPIFKFEILTLAEVSRLISTLSESTSFGHDKLDSIAIKAAADLLNRPLQHIVNTSLKNSQFCQKWKLSKLTPRLKGSGLDKLSTSSYRPVAALNTVSKLVERAAQQQLLKFLEKTGQINKSNHAYRKCLSTTTTLMEVMDEIYQGVEDKKFTEIMTVDQSSAFDCVCHDLLLEKLKRYNLGIEAINWVRNYLKDRTQYVEIGDKQSRMVPTTMGVPQGSVIGPLLYAVYTNEMTETTKREGCNNIVHQDTKSLFGQQCTDCGILSLYADDSTFTISSKDRNVNQDRIRKTLDEITLFLNDNNLVINQTKTSLTECMVAQKRGKTNGTPPHLIVEKEPGVLKKIENKEYTRILGANIQGNVLWSNHLETGEKALLPQVRKQLGSLKHLGGQIPASCRMKLARGLILGKMSYLMPIWGAATH